MKKKNKYRFTVQTASFFKDFITYLDTEIFMEQMHTMEVREQIKFTLFHKKYCS